MRIEIPQGEKGEIFIEQILETIEDKTHKNPTQFTENWKETFLI